MGGVLTAPMGLLASCCGSCAASCFCAAMQGGHVTNDHAARQVLVWLQVFTATMAITLSQAGHGWLSGPCDSLHSWVSDSMSRVGICSCKWALNQDQCFADQLVFRFQTAAAGMFLLLVLLSLSGCSSCAARSYVVGKFFAVVIAAFVLLFLPNDVFTALGNFASCASALFLVVQAVFIIDLSYTWNEQWYTNALAARRGNGGTRAYRAWQVGILASAALTFAAMIAGAVILVKSFPGPANWALVGPALGGSIVLLVVSITEWCQHGSLLTSCAVGAYLMWLCYEALSVLPTAGYKQGGFLRWVELLACGATLFGVARSTGLGQATAGPAAASSPARLEAGGEGGGVEAPTEEAESSPTDPKAYAVQCASHAAGATYICAALAPFPSWASFSLRTVAAASALLLYGWSLVAPKVLTGRNF